MKAPNIIQNCHYLVLILMTCSVLSTSYLSGREQKSLSKKIQGYFDTTNTPANITEATSVSDDIIGVNFIGGSGFIRTQVSDVNPAHVSLPRLSVGCGGIDYAIGGINIASKEEMKKALLNIAKNGATHAFLLGLETISPLTGDVMSKIQTWANQINSMNVNSCEIGASLAEGLWPRTEGADKYICSHAGAKKGIFQDMIESRHGCRDQESKASKKAIHHAKDEGMIVGDYNLAWEVIQKMQIEDENVKDLYLNISGTVIQTKGNITFYPSQVEKALEVLIFGGGLENAYRFDKKDPLRINTQETIFVPLGRAEKEKIQKVLRSLQDKILGEGLGEEKYLTSEEKELIATTQFPISSLMILMGQWEGQNMNKHVSPSECAEIIAFERSTHYIEEIIKNLLLQVDAIQSKQVSSLACKEYKQGLDQTLILIERRKLDNYRKISEKQKVIQFLIEIERNMRDNPAGGL